MQHTTLVLLTACAILDTLCFDHIRAAHASYLVTFLFTPFQLLFFSTNYLTLSIRACRAATTSSVFILRPMIFTSGNYVGITTASYHLITYSRPGLHPEAGVVLANDRQACTCVNVQ